MKRLEYLLTAAELEFERAKFDFAAGKISVVDLSRTAHLLLVIHRHFREANGEHVTAGNVVPFVRPVRVPARAPRPL